MADHRRVGGEQRAPAQGMLAHSDAPSHSGASGLPGRAQILAAVTEVLSRSAGRWAWQGPADAVDRWRTEAGPKDLDVWYDRDPAGDHDPAALLCARFPCARVAAADDRRRLRHASLSVETAAGPAVVDFTHGDLRVGPVLLIPAAEIEVDPAAHRLTGAAAVADLLVRPVLRGRLPESQRLAEARAAWAGIDVAGRARLRRRLAGELGDAVAGALVAVAAGARPDPGLPGRARLRLAARSLAPATITATWAQRRTVLPAGRSRGPVGLPIRGVLVALVGTDGAGKSTVADGLHERLRRYGLSTSAAYFGMARGNLPGVGLARRLLGVGSVALSGAVPTPGTAAPARTPGTGSAPLDHPVLRRMAAWFYAGEYVWRYVRMVGPPLARRHVVIADRWVYDLRESPWPGSRAARFAERLLPAPDVLVLPDAPIDVIHGRKPERSLAAQRAQQELFRRLLAEHPARHAEMVVDTSGRTADPLAALVALVVQTAHRSHRHDP